MKQIQEKPVKQLVSKYEWRLLENDIKEIKIQDYDQKQKSGKKFPELLKDRG